MKDETDAAQMADISAVRWKYMAGTILVRKIFLMLRSFLCQQSMKVLLFVRLLLVSATPDENEKDTVERCFPRATANCPNREHALLILLLPPTQRRCIGKYEIFLGKGYRNQRMIRI